MIKDEFPTLLTQDSVYSSPKKSLTLPTHHTPPCNRALLSFSTSDLYLFLNPRNIKEILWTCALRPWDHIFWFRWLLKSASTKMIPQQHIKILGLGLWPFLLCKTRNNRNDRCAHTYCKSSDKVNSKWKSWALGHFVTWQAVLSTALLPWEMKLHVSLRLTLGSLYVLHLKR